MEEYRGSVLISVVIPFYREISLIGRAVASICGQKLESYTGISFEILIGNDGDHSSEEIIAAIAQEHRPAVRVIRNAGPRGPGGARNACLRESHGELIAFLDADDYWLDGKLKRQLQLINQGVTFIATGYRFEDSGVAVAPPIALEKSIDVFRKRGIGTSTVLIHRTVLENKYFRDLRFAQDIDFWYALSRSAAFRYGAVAAPCVIYSRGGSTRNKFTQLRFVHKVLKLNQIGLFDRSTILAGYATTGLINHYLRRK